MGKTKTYIELNGKRYDTGNGSIMKPDISAKETAHHINTPKAQGQVVDGIVRKAAGKMAFKPPRHKPAHNTHHKKQPAKTLMRQSVRKPTLGSLFHAKATPLAAAGDMTIAANAPLWPSVSPKRVSHAKAIHKSKLISRFGPAGVSVKTTLLSVKNPPSANFQSTPRAGHATSQNPFTKALMNATSHEQPKLKKPHLHQRVAKRLHISSKKLNVGAAVVSALLLGGFMLQQNLPNLTVRLASARAGFHASLPSYHPAGFSLKGPIEYSPGQLTLNFQSNSDSRNFQVKQQASNWNSETLLQAYVSKSKQPYQTYQDSGRIVYINNAGANLVTDNKWIQVKSDGTLSTQQLLSIVKSIN